MAEAIVRSANKTINIFAGVLNARVYGTAEFISEVRSFLSEKGRKVAILLEKPQSIDEVDHPFIRDFRDNDDVDFYTFVSSLQAEKIPSYHFMVSDGMSYRFEENKDFPSAVAAFGDQKGGKKLVEKFSELLRSSIKIDFTPA